MSSPPPDGGSGKPARHHRQEAKAIKRSWTEEETQALLQGVARWGKGKWSNIKDDPDFGPILMERTTIDIKDKYRNLLTRKRTNGAQRVVLKHNPDDPVEANISPKLPPVTAAAAADSSIRTLRGKIGDEGDRSHISGTTGRKRAKQEQTADDIVAQSAAANRDSENGSTSPKSSRGVLRVDEGANQQQQTSSSSTIGNAAKNKSDNMTLTVNCEKRNLVLNLKGTTKASQLLQFAVREFRLDDSYTLMSEGIGSALDLAKSLREQVPMFDLLRVTKKSPAANRV